MAERGALKRVLRRQFRYSGAVAMQWILFGTSGHPKPPAEGALRGFHRCTGVLSAWLKCLGGSAWLHPAGALRPWEVHNCALRRDAPAAALADGTPMRMRGVEVDGEPGVSYFSHLREPAYSAARDVSNDTSLALFHYITRSAGEFLTQKITRRSGSYAQEFLAVDSPPVNKESPSVAGTPPQATLDSMSDAELHRRLAAFERLHGLDGAHAICEQGAALADAVDAALAAGQL